MSKVTFDDDLRRAVERLNARCQDGTNATDVRLQRFDCTAPDEIADWSVLKPIAALIEAAAIPWSPFAGDYMTCRVCGAQWTHMMPAEHAADCALVALVRAINGES